MTLQTFSPLVQLEASFLYITYFSVFRETTADPFMLSIIISIEVIHH